MTGHAVKPRPGEWAAALELVVTALDRPPAERQAWLQAAIPETEPGIRALAVRLLAERRAIETGDFLGAGALAAARGLLPEPPPGGPAFEADRLVGPWRLLRPLGTGGMASVWLATRADASHRRPVALKLAAVAGASDWIARRFEVERDILSSLAHPHIASVLDAGVDGAQPWLAMEFVDGPPITRYAGERALGVAERLRLFRQVLLAVQHAHTRLVIHRDIKPSNVLVGDDGDGVATVKLLDFGVAKLLQPADDPAGAATLTRHGGRPMTLQYASPEQIAGRPLGTASDVYSLGVLLYELLTGALPYRVKRSTPAAIEEAIATADIQAPSRRATDDVVARALRGDVDTIVGKALESSPERRYGSAEAFADDIERHLASKPIRARPASAGYVLRKALLRHRIAFTVATALLLALVAGLAGTLWQAERARDQAGRAEAALQFLSDLLAMNDPQQAQGRELSARQLLDSSAGRIDSEFAGRPDVQIRLHETVAGIYNKLGVPTSSIVHARRSAEIHEALGRIGSHGHVEARFAEAQALMDAGELPAAEAAARAVMQLAERHFGPLNEWTAPLLNDLSFIVAQQGDLAQASSLAEQAVLAALSSYGEQSAAHLAAKSRLSEALLARGQLRRSRELQAEVLALSEKVPGHQTTDRLIDAHKLARIDSDLGDHGAAEATLRDLVPRLDRQLGPRNDRTLKARSLQAQTLAHLGRYGEAVEVQRTNLANALASEPPIPDVVAVQQLVLAKTLLAAARYDEGLVLARQGRAWFDVNVPKPTWLRERGRWVLGELLLGSGRHDEGTAAIATALAGIDAMDGAAANPQRAEVALSLAVARRHGSQADEVVALADGACRTMAAAQDPASIPVLRCAAIAAWLRAAAPRTEAGDVLADAFSAAREAVTAKLPERHALRAELLAAEAEVRRDRPGQSARAAALREQAAVLYASILSRALPDRLVVLH